MTIVTAVTLFVMAAGASAAPMKLFGGVSSNLYEINTSTGAATLAASNNDIYSGFNGELFFVDLTALSEGPVVDGDSGGSIWAAHRRNNNINLAELDAYYTGSAMAAGYQSFPETSLPAGAQNRPLKGFAYSAADNAFYLSMGATSSYHIIKIDATSFTPVAWGLTTGDSGGAWPNIDGMAVDPDTNTLHAWNSDGGRVYSIDTSPMTASGGTLVPQILLGGGLASQGMAATSDTLWGDISRTGRTYDLHDIFTFTPSTAGSAEIGPTGLTGVVGGMASVPEPATMILLGVGGCLALVRRRRR